MPPLHATITRLSASHLPDAAHLLTFLNPDSPQHVILSRLQKITKDHPHYQLWGTLLDGKLVGVAGIWLGTKVWCGSYLEIDNLIIHPDFQSKGLGTLLIQQFESIARENNCPVMVIDSYTTNHASNRLYHKLGFEIWSFHFIRKLADFTGSGSS